jgi:hypothetical protein
VAACCAVLLILLAHPQSPECTDAASCQAAAQDAAARGEFEAFHDLAWRAMQKGRPNDPKLMVLVARAQSLSGRPGDALVMLRRLAQSGIATDASTSDDFRRVRALPQWPEVEALLSSAGKPAPPEPAPSAAKPSAPSRAAAPTAAVSASSPATAPAAKVTAPSARAIEDESVPFESIEPTGLVYDAVSRRFIVGDRRENRLVIFDNVFKRATNMVGAESAGFFGLAAVAIDPRRGDLWVANSSDGRGAALHKLQLVSGRVLFELAVPAELGKTRFVDAAVLGDGTVLLLDAKGRRLLTVPPAQRAFKRSARVDVDRATSLAANIRSLAYVAHAAGILRVDLTAGTTAALKDAPGGLLRIRPDGGALVAVQPAATGHRIVRLRLDAAGRRVVRVDVLDETTLADPSAIATVDGAVFYITSLNGALVMRRLQSQK